VELRKLLNEYCSLYLLLAIVCLVKLRMFMSLRREVYIEESINS